VNRSKSVYREKEFGKASRDKFAHSEEESKKARNKEYGTNSSVKT